MEHIRKKGVVPIIILSAQDTEADKTLRLGMGQMTISQSHSP